MNENSFEINLVKGKITELIFELMFRELNKFTVVHYGYEYSQPELAQHRGSVIIDEVLDTISISPDFILVSDDKTQVYFVEVKYRHHLNEEELLKTSQKIVNKWDHTQLFVATPEGFFYSPCHTIINNGGRTEPLPENIIPKEIQERYLSLLNHFISE